MRHLRNIYSFQVFEAVARLQNITHGARELNVTQSSASYHIKKIEEDLGVALFERKAGGVWLTDEGKALALQVSRGLDLIASGVDAALGRSSMLRVAVLPMLASRWLSSRLGSLWDEQPHLQLSFQNHNNTFVSMENPAAFADLGFQWGQGDWRDFDAVRLWPEQLIVVCSPAYLAEHPIEQPSDLNDCMLIHVDNDQMWAEWYRRNGVSKLKNQAEMFLEDRHFQLSAAINGLGVALFSKNMVEADLLSGALVDPFQKSFDTAFAYYLVSPKDHPVSGEAARFKSWLLRQCADGAASF